MNTIKQDIINIKQNILNSFDDPIPENFLKNFVIGGKFIRSTLALTYLKILNIILVFIITLKKKKLNWKKFVREKF